jgi:hypothetical protein
MASTTRVRKLTPEEAQAQYFNRIKRTYAVSAKFAADHLLKSPVLSTSEALSQAMDRYRRDQTEVSSWMIITASTLIEKAKNGKAVACIYQNAQQLALAVKAERRTITLTARTRKEIQGSNPDAFPRVTLADGDRYITYKSRSDNITLCVRGPWDPLTGAVTIHHYGEGSLPKVDLLAKYLEWEVDGSGNILGPVAKK